MRTAIRDAMRFATSAARKLETGDATAARIFQLLFGHPPTRPVPWANNRTSGAIVAHRIRKVAQALQGRGTHYRCGCPGLPATVNAFAAPPNAVALCARFWQQSRAFRAESSSTRCYISSTPASSATTSGSGDGTMPTATRPSSYVSQATRQTPRT